MGLVATFRTSYQRFIDRYDRHQLQEFLPAALEVIETPPSPTGRILGLLIVLFFGIAVAWAFIGHVDILATAPGRLLPTGEVKTIQSIDPGIVRAIHVKDGDHVHAGQLLIELDPTQINADRDQYARGLIHARLDVARLSGLKTAIATGRAPALAAVPGAPPELVAEAEAAMRADAAQQAARIADLTQQVSQKGAEAGEMRAGLQKTNASLPILAEKERIHRELNDQGYGTSLSYLDSQQQLSDARHDLRVYSQRTAEAAAARAALERQRDALKAQYAADILAQLRKAQEQENELAQQSIKAQSRSSQTALRSPIDGVVEQLSVHTLRGVVTPAQNLMIIVPDKQTLMIEARLADRDAGFVRAGQPVKVKVETFSFTRYGMLDGRVIGVSRDVVNDAPMAGGQQSNAEPASGPRQQGAAAPSYVARIALSEAGMMIDGQFEPLQPGMVITAEIKTGDRTIIDYLFSPLARRTQESLHER